MAASSTGFPAPRTRARADRARVGILSDVAITDEEVRAYVDDGVLVVPPAVNPVPVVRARRRKLSDQSKLRRTRNNLDLDLDARGLVAGRRRDPGAAGAQRVQLIVLIDGDDVDAIKLVDVDACLWV